MADLSDRFWQASLPEIKQGYIYDQQRDDFICLICGQSYANGNIYPDGSQLYEAKKIVQIHITQNHQSTFYFLLNLDKKITGLTEHQKTIVELFYGGSSDKEVAKTLNTESTSTVRNHRFNLREKQKQAKITLAILELLGDHIPKKDTFIAIPRSSRQVDDRYAITEQDSEKILAAYFKQGPYGPLDHFPLKEKKRVAILRHLMRLFDASKTYTEHEVNDVLKQFYHDYVLIRRNLIEYGFMDRTKDGSSYWVKL